MHIRNILSALQSRPDDMFIAARTAFSPLSPVRTICWKHIDNRHYNDLVLNFVNLCYTDLLSYDRRSTYDQFSRSQGQI